MTVGGISSITNGQGALQSSKMTGDKAKFDALVQEIYNSTGAGQNVSSSQTVTDGRLNGDYTSGFTGTFKGEDAKTALPRGAAANQANPHVVPKKIDKTSKLYEKSLEMESYIVKMMISSMRKTVMKTETGSENSYAKNMYEDMLYDEYATMMTKGAGFGLADQMYLQLAEKAYS